MTGRPYNHAAPAEVELDLRAARARRLEVVLMLTAETLCSIAGLAAFLALLRGELGWSALFALSSACSYLAAFLIEPA